METILRFDKLFYHFSHSGVPGIGEKRTEKKENLTSIAKAAKGRKESKRKIVKGDKAETEKLLLI